MLQNREAAQLSRSMKPARYHPGHQPRGGPDRTTVRVRLVHSRHRDTTTSDRHPHYAGRRKTIRTQVTLVGLAELDPAEYETCISRTLPAALASSSKIEIEPARPQGV